MHFEAKLVKVGIPGTRIIQQEESETKQEARNSKRKSTMLSQVVLHPLLPTQVRPSIGTMGRDLVFNFLED